MKVWNVSGQTIKQLYNNRIVIIQPNSAVEFGDDLAVFLLNKKEIRGAGLVQLKETDNREERYKQGRYQIYQYADEKYNDYLRHCEEREAQRLQPLTPHKEIQEWKAKIDEYEKWQKEGEKVDKKLVDTLGETRVYVCAMCDMEFTSKEGYLKHSKVHEEDKNAINIGAAADTGQGEG